jgi:hypothetical protein
LWPLLQGKTYEVRPYACAGQEQGGSGVWALRTPDWGYILPEDNPARGPELYVKPDDRWEVNNVVQHHLELTEHLGQTLRGFAEAACRSGPLVPPLLRDVEAAKEDPLAKPEGES